MCMEMYPGINVMLEYVIKCKYDMDECIFRVHLPESLSTANCSISTLCFCNSDCNHNNLHSSYYTLDLVQPV